MERGEDGGEGRGKDIRDEAALCNRESKTKHKAIVLNIYILLTVFIKLSCNERATKDPSLTTSTTW